jgi:hypothetical protein
MLNDSDAQRNSQKDVSDVVDLLYGHDVAELDYMARIYQKYGKHEKAAEILKLLRPADNESEDQDVIDMDQWADEHNRHKKQA